MTVTLRTLTANDTEAIEQVRQYFRNYAAWLGALAFRIHRLTIFSFRICIGIT